MAYSQKRLQRIEVALKSCLNGGVPISGRWPILAVASYRAASTLIRRLVDIRFARQAGCTSSLHPFSSPGRGGAMAKGCLPADIDAGIEKMGCGKRRCTLTAWTGLRGLCACLGRGFAMCKFHCFWHFRTPLQAIHGKCHNMAVSVSDLRMSLTCAV